MKLTVNHRAFADAVAFVARLSPKRPTQPILTGVLLQAEDGVLAMTVFDYQTAAETAVDATVDEGGVVLVHAGYLAQIAAKLPAKDVQLETTDRELKIRCGTVRASLPLMEDDLYPRPDFTGDTIVEISGAVFEDAILRTAPSASKNPAVATIMGMHIATTGDKVTFATTDRYRVAHMELALHADADAEFIILATVMLEAAKAFSTSETVALAATEKGALVMRGDRGTLLVRQLEGRFPPVARLFPKEAVATARLVREVIADATSRAALAVDAEAAARYAFTEGECSVSGSSAVDGTGVSEEFEVEFSGDPRSVALKPQFVLDGVNACRADQIDLWLTDGSQPDIPGPVMFTAGGGFRYLLQPNLILK